MRRSAAAGSTAASAAAAIGERVAPQLRAAVTGQLAVVDERRARAAQVRRRTAPPAPAALPAGAHRIAGAGRRQSRPA